MIGFGSNRLTCCRRGGMSVTQAGRGGMEWLAGGRTPLWAQWWLPYSRQAGEALKAAFPTQWPTIRDYGFAHPEIVGYMNAYAPEDAKIAYSLVEGIGTRWLVGDGTAYIRTDYYASTNSGFDVEVSLTGDSNANCGIIGGGNSGYIKTLELYYWNNLWYIANGSEFGTQASAYIGHIYRIIRDGNSWQVYDNGTLSKSGTKNVGTYTTTTKFHLFATARSNSILAIAKAKMTYVKILNHGNGELDCHFVPYKKNGAMGMIDLLTGTFYPNANSSGTFTELIESPS